MDTENAGQYVIGAATLGMIEVGQDPLGLLFPLDSVHCPAAPNPVNPPATPSQPVPQHQTRTQMDSLMPTHHRSLFVTP